MKITLRADSGFCRHRAGTEGRCDRHGADYLIGIAKNPALLRLAGPLMLSAQEQFDQSHQKQRIFGEFVYAAGTWDRPRRTIAKAEHSR